MSMKILQVLRQKFHIGFFDSLKGKCKKNCAVQLFVYTGIFNFDLARMYSMLLSFIHFIHQLLCL